MYNKTTAITILLLLIILINSKSSYCNYDITLKPPVIDEIRVIPCDNGFKKLVSRISFFNYQEIDTNKIRPFIYFSLRKCGNKQFDPPFGFYVTHSKFSKSDIISRQKNKSISMNRVKHDSKESEESTVYDLVLDLEKKLITDGFTKEIEKYNINNIFEKRRFEFNFTIKLEYIDKISKPQEITSTIISEELNRWMKGLSLSLTNISIKPTKQLAAKFKFAFVKDYIHLYNKNHENTNEYVLLDNQELSNPDLSLGNGNYISHEDVIYPSFKPKTVYPNANSSIEKLEISSDPGSYSGETSSESNDHTNIDRNDNASTNPFEGTLDKYNRKFQNSGTDKRKSSLKDAGFNGPASVENIGNFGNNSRSTVASNENMDTNKTITSGIYDTITYGTNNTKSSGIYDTITYGTNNTKSSGIYDTITAGTNNTKSSGIDNNITSSTNNTKSSGINNNITSRTNNTKSSGINNNITSRTNNTASSGTDTRSGNTPTSINNENNPNDPAKKSRTIKIIGIIVISIVLFGVSVYFYFIIKRIYFIKKEVEYVY